MPNDWQALVAFVVARDGGICHLCGKAGANTADHLVPWARGGSDAPGNLRAAHKSCNIRRKAGPLPHVHREGSRFG